MNSEFIFSSDSVTEGHPDKLCDQISDAIVDQFLRNDPFAHVIAECALATGVVFIATQFQSREVVDIPEVARDVIKQVGYEGEEFNAKDCTVMTNIHELPAPGYSQFSAESYASGDLDRIIATHPVTVFGFACNHNDACIPLSLWAAHQLARRLDRLRHEETLPYLLPDGLSQVSIEYTHRRPHRVHTVTLITSHDIGKADSPAGISSDLHDMVIRPVFDEMPIKMDAQTVVHINPEGPILAGGPTIHAGLTGRKTAIDTYGQYSRHGGSALSGKDPSRIERIGAYYARYVAKNVIAAGLAAECEVLLSYTAGQSKPVSVQLETYGSGKVAEQKLLEFVLRCFDFRVGAIIHAFKLHTLPIDKREGMFRKLACYGHMGRTDLAVPWENTDKCSALAELAGL